MKLSQFEKTSSRKKNENKHSGNHLLISCSSAIFLNNSTHNLWQTHNLIFQSTFSKFFVLLKNSWPSWHDGSKGMKIPFQNREIFAWVLISIESAFLTHLTSVHYTIFHEMSFICVRASWQEVFGIFWTETPPKTRVFSFYFPITVCCFSVSTDVHTYTHSLPVDGLAGIDDCCTSTCIYTHTNPYTLTNTHIQTHNKQQIHTDASTHTNPDRFVESKSSSQKSNCALHHSK